MAEDEGQVSCRRAAGQLLVGCRSAACSPSVGVEAAPPQTEEVREVLGGRERRGEAVQMQPAVVLRARLAQARHTDQP